jgi:hypothetical protein
MHMKEEHFKKAFPAACKSPRLASVTKRLLPLVILLSVLLPGLVYAQDSAPDAAPDAAPAWLEPRGLSIVDLVGVVPEEHLRGAIVRYWPGVGVVLYEWGRRVGDIVTVNVKFVSQYPNMVMCLGKPGDRDEWLVVVPESTMRVFDNGVDVTRRLVTEFEYFPAGYALPNANSDGQRYPEYGGLVRYNAVNEVIVPANSGCWYWLQSPSNNLTAEFKFNVPQVIAVDVLGSQSTSFPSYIGPGYAGLLGSLQDQMGGRFSDRHPEFRFTPPTGTNYILVRQPLTPVDPYGQNPYYPGAGTYRVRQRSGALSVDHIHTMGLPYYGQWRDADQSGGADYLPHLTDPVGVTLPEYFVPVGIAYDPCMTNGGCSSSLLDAIYQEHMSLTVYLYRVNITRLGLTAIPLRQVGPGYNPNAAAVLSAQSPSSEGIAPAPAIQPAWNYHNYLPSLAKPPNDFVADASQCPCGWFTADGRMVGYVPHP